jgi:DNA-binding response OmpR family regulator
MRVAMTLPQYRRGEVSVDGVPVHLTPNEAELVALLLASPPDRGLTKETLIEAIWPNPDTQAVTAPKVIDVMVMRARKKGVPIETVWGRGFVIPEHVRDGERAPAPYFRLAA